MSSINSDIIELLTKLRDLADLRGETYRANAFDRALVAARECKTRIGIKTVLPGVGQHTHARIREFLRAKKTSILNDLDKQINEHRELSKMLGVGPKTLHDWIQIGVTSIASLRRAVAKGTITLTHQQQYGLKYYSDLIQRIPRADVTSLVEIIKSAVIQSDPNIILDVAGSYRRGAESSGDVDILLTNRARFDDDLLARVVVVLQSDPNYIDTLVAGQQRTSFLYKHHGVVRQVDLLHIPYASYYAALVYFTGSYSFNEAMRGYAKRQGYRLNQDGLYRVTGATLTLVPTSSERDLFAKLELMYVEPSRRVDGSAVIKLNE